MTRPTARPAASSCSRPTTPPGTLLAELQAEIGAASTPLAAAMAVSELIPDRLEYRQGRDLRRLDR